MFVLYVTISLTDFVPEPETRYQAGFVLIIFVTGNLAINIGLMTVSTVSSCFKSVKIHYRKKRYNRKIRQLKEDRKEEEKA